MNKLLHLCTTICKTSIMFISRIRLMWILTEIILKILLQEQHLEPLHFVLPWVTQMIINKSQTCQHLTSFNTKNAYCPQRGNQ